MLLVWRPVARLALHVRFRRRCSEELENGRPVVAGRVRVHPGVHERAQKSTRSADRTRRAWRRSLAPRAPRLCPVRAVWPAAAPAGAARPRRRAVLANDWTRTCEVCGELQRLELRLVRGVVRDQPRCSACRHKRLGKRRPATGVDERQQGLFESRDGAGVDQTPDEAPTSPETPAALQAHPHLQQSQTPVPSQAPTCIMCGAVGTVDSLARFWSAPPGEVRPREHWRCLRHPFY